MGGGLLIALPQLLPWLVPTLPPWTPLANRRCLVLVRARTHVSEWHVCVGGDSGMFLSPPLPHWGWWQEKCHTTFLPASLLWRFMRARLDEAPLLLSRTSTNDCEKATP